MAHASTLEDRSPGLVKGVARAPCEPAGRCHALAHLTEVSALARAYRRQRADAAVGVDGVTKEHYGRELEAHLPGRHARLKAPRYRHQPIRRVHIPKGPGKTRPMGIAAFEDKVVQDAVREGLEVIYEQDFLACSYGFRPGRSAHDAVRTLDQIVHRGEVAWILEADIGSFFDSLDRTALQRRLELRVADGALLRRIGKGLHVGVLDGEALSEPERGTTQGSVLLLLLGNVYLPYVLDRWFETEVKPRRRGKATLIRYGDDFIVGFEREDDARRVWAVLDKRLGRFGLTLHPDTTRLLPFGRPPQGQQSGKGPATFDFVGCTGYGARSRKGRWGRCCKTRRASLRRAKKALYDWWRRHRHQPGKTQHAALSQRVRGHFNYFGVSGNFRSLLRLVEATKRAWYKWLCRRSQRTRLTWERFGDLLQQFPLPRPRMTVRIWGG
jgi:RNA-directed DNA polymerase